VPKLGPLRSLAPKAQGPHVMTSSRANITVSTNQRMGKALAGFRRTTI
jgi:hypothetical protein